MRYLNGCIIDWVALFHEAYKSLKPGGWLQSYEASPTVLSDDGTLHEHTAVSRWGSLFVDGGKKIGRTFLVVNDGLQVTAMKEAGFVDIEERWIKVGHYPRLDPIPTPDSVFFSLVRGLTF